MLIECSHCPAPENRWVVLDPAYVLDSVNAHILLLHPNTGEWVQDDDWAVLSEVDIATLAEVQERITQ